MKYLFFLVFALSSTIIYSQTENTGIKLSGNWSYHVDYSQQTVRIKGDKIVNKDTAGKSGTIKISLYLTNTKYSGGSITGYALVDYQLDQLEAGYRYFDINKLLDFNVNPPSDNYYVTLLLLEYTAEGFVIRDYLTFDETIAFDDRKTERALNALAQGLNAVSNSLNNSDNNYNNSNNNNSNYNNYNNNSNSNTGHMENVTCSFCHGTGKNPAKEHPALFGRGTDNSDRRLNQQCPICKSWEIHYHKTCPSCGGKGYTKKWIY